MEPWEPGRYNLSKNCPAPECCLFLNHSLPPSLPWGQDRCATHLPRLGVAVPQGLLHGQACTEQLDLLSKNSWPAPQGFDPSFTWASTSTLLLFLLLFHFSSSALQGREGHGGKASRPSKVHIATRTHTHTHSDTRREQQPPVVMAT